MVVVYLIIFVLVIAFFFRPLQPHEKKVKINKTKHVPCEACLQRYEKECFTKLCDTCCDTVRKRKGLKPDKVVYLHNGSFV